MTAKRFLGWSLPVIIMFAAVGIRAEDWTQWRGLNRAGVWTETGILEEFPEDGLRIKWRAPIHSGYSGPAVAQGKVIVLDWQLAPGSRALEGHERAIALDEGTGKVLWERAWPAQYARIMASYAIGPRATPTIDGDRVYVMGSVGNLLCLKLNTGEVVWQKDFVKEYGSTIPVWGTTSSPLVDGNRLICVVGAEGKGIFMAFDKMTGKEIWATVPANSEMGYCQPIIIEAGGTRQLIVWYPKGVASLDPATGKPHWEQEWEVGSGMSVATPVHSGRYLLFTQFYRGSLMMELSDNAPTAKVLWMGKSKSEIPDKTDGLHSLITTPIIEGDYIYGVCSYGELRCLDARTGERIWKSDKMTRQGRWGTAFMVKNGDRYIVNNDLGDLILAKFTPEGYVEFDRTKLIEPTTSAGIGPRRAYDATINWSHPAYANGCVFARNDKEIICAVLKP